MKDTLASVESTERVVQTGQGHKLRYDALLVAVGGRLAVDFDHVLTFRDADAGQVYERVVEDVEDRHSASRMRPAVGGHGARERAGGWSRGPERGRCRAARSARQRVVDQDVGVGDESMEDIATLLVGEVDRDAAPALVDLEGTPAAIEPTATLDEPALAHDAQDLLAA